MTDVEVFTNGRDGTTWMVVYTAYNVSEAHIVRGRLEVEGIPSMIHGQVGSTALGIGYGSMGEILVLVQPEHYDAACDLLEPEPSRPLPDNTQTVTFREDEKEHNENEHDRE